jgi:hypothetical protein
MPKEPKRQIVEPVTEARRAESDPSDLMLLVIGLGLAPLILGGAWLVCFHT